MRIAHVSVTYPPYKAGVGNVCYAFASGLVNRGHEVHVFTSSESGVPDSETVDGVQIHRLQTRLQLGEARFLPELLEINGFDLIHLHLPFYLGAEIVLVAARQKQIPLVVTYHMDTLLRGLPGIAARLHDWLIGRLVLRKADQVFFTTMDYARVSRAKWLLDRQNPAGALPNGVDTNMFHPDLDGLKIRRQLGISDEDRVVVLVAGLDRAHFFKGVPILLQAFRKIVAQEKNGARRSRLVIVGEGNLRPAYQAMMIRLGLTNHVTFAGRVSEMDLPLFYAASDIGVLPSFTMGEAFGIVLLESMACAKPVVASRLPGVRDVVDEGVDGFLVEPGNVDDLAKKLQLLIDDPDLCHTMGQKGLEKIKLQYAWPIIIDQLEMYYKQVLNRWEQA